MTMVYDDYRLQRKQWQVAGNYSVSVYHQQQNKTKVKYFYNIMIPSRSFTFCGGGGSMSL